MNLTVEDTMREKLGEICDTFGISGNVVSYEIITHGNINTTYKVIVNNNGLHNSYIVQKINTFVFKEPEKIMSNIHLITNHIREKINDTSIPQMTFLFSSEGKNYYIEGENFWRVHLYIDSVTYNTCDNTDVLKYAGEAFGKFQKYLSDFNAEKLYETIPDFHNTKKRLDKLVKDAEEDEFSRVASVREELDYIKTMYSESVRLTNMLSKGELPLRVTHNDTKINNVLFDKKTNRPLTVIDLDTVMPGLVAHDFGDAVRFAANTASEDEPDVSKISLDLDKYRAFTEGFISSVDSLTQNEFKTLALGAFTITIELASRFLDDYITGDKYFKINYPEHNIVRTRCQIALAKDMSQKYNEMNFIIYDSIKKTVHI